MKKLLSLLSVMVVFTSLNANAANFTLQATPQSNVNTTIRTATPKATRATSTGDAFCKGMENWYNQSSSSVVSSAVNASVRGHDPYLIEINGVRYMMIKDNKDGVFNKNDILGITDTTTTVFASLRPLDLNRDNKLTGEELTKAGIRLVKINSNGKLLYKDKSQDFKNSNIVFIHMTELRKAYANNGRTGDFGYYDVVIKNAQGKKQLVTGVVTFETEQEIRKYFN